MWGVQGFVNKCIHYFRQPVEQPSVNSRVCVVAYESFASSASHESGDMAGEGTYLTAESKDTDCPNRELLHLILHDQQSQDVLENNFYKIQALLQSGANPNASHKAGNTALHLVGCTKNWMWYHSALITLLLQYGADATAINDHGETPLHKIVACGGDAMSVQKLLTAGADVNAVDHDSYTSLHRWAQQQQENNSSENLKVGKHLLDKGADPNLQETHSHTALHFAIQQSKSCAAIELLLEAGADPNLSTHQGESALHCAVKAKLAPDAHRELITLLLCYKADPTLTNNLGYIPFQCALFREKSPILHLLVVKGHYDEKYESTALHCAANDANCPIPLFDDILTHTKDIHTLDDWNNTPLHLAAYAGFAYAVKRLAHRMSDVNVRNISGNTPLHYAIESLLKTVIRDIETEHVLQELEKLIDFLETQRYLGYSLELDLPFSHAYTDTINVLLDRGANPQLLNNKGYSAIKRCKRWLKRHL